MNSGMISVRYAKALLACAKDQNTEKQLFQVFSCMADNFMQYHELMPVLKNPTLSDLQKRQLIVAAAGNPENTLFVQFVDLLLKNKREEQLQRIALCYCDIYQKDSHICVGHITTAKPLDAETDKRIRQFLQKWSCREVELQTKINPEVLGGFVIDVGDERLDASVAHQLQRIKKELTKKCN